MSTLTLKRPMAAWRNGWKVHTWHNQARRLRTVWLRSRPQVSVRLRTE